MKNMKIFYNISTYFLLIIILSLYSCNNDQNNNFPYPCIDGECDIAFEIDELVSPGVYHDDNGFWHIQHQGYNYFTIKGIVDELASSYIINGTPLISTLFDSDYWVWIDGITFTVPLYSPLGFFTDDDFENPIPVGTSTYTIEDMANNFPPLNIAGYSYNPDSDLTDLGTYSRYTYNPQQQFFFDKQMAGDTAKVFIKTTFNTDVGPSVDLIQELNIIFE